MPENEKESVIIWTAEAQLAAVIGGALECDCAALGAKCKNEIDVLSAHLPDIGTVEECGYAERSRSETRTVMMVISQLGHP